MARIRIFSASINDLYYDTAKISKMSFDEAVHFFNWEDEFGAATINMRQIDDCTENEGLIAPEEIETGSPSDTLLVWYKIDCC
jgi:hypothetical protein